MQNLKGQGDTIRLLEERTKTFPRRKIIFGGTPTVKGVSAVEDAYTASDQRKFWVPCHQCNEAHVLAWDNVIWSEDREQPNRIALTFQVLHAVIRLLDDHDRRRRALHRRRGTRANEFQKTPRKIFEQLPVVRGAALADVHQAREPRRRLDHRSQFLLCVLFRRRLFREHHHHRARIQVDPPADVIIQHAVGPRRLRRLHADHFMHSAIVQRIMDPPHPGREIDRVFSRVG